MKLSLEWSARDVALEPSIVACPPPLATRLLQRIHAYPAEELEQLSALTTHSLLVVKGPGHLLPWFPGVRYYGHEKSAPNLYFPSQLQASIKIELLERAFLKQYRDPPFLLTLKSGPETRYSVISLHALQSLSHALLEQWLRKSTRNSRPGP